MPTTSWSSSSGRRWNCSSSYTATIASTSQPEPGHATEPHDHRPALLQLAACRSQGKKVLIFCGDDEPEELGGQICADLFECRRLDRASSQAAACRMTKCSSSSASTAPTCSIMFAHAAQRRAGRPQADRLSPRSRQLPEHAGHVLRRNLQARRRLSEEIGADLYAPDAAEAVAVANAQPVEEGDRRSADGRSHATHPQGAKPARRSRWPSRSARIAPQSGEPELR